MIFLKVFGHKFWIFNVFLLHLDNFADYKRLRGGVYFLDSFPMTPSGKILRRRIKDIVTQLYKNKHDEEEDS